MICRMVVDAVQDVRIIVGGRVYMPGFQLRTNVSAMPFMQ